VLGSKLYPALPFNVVGQCAHGFPGNFRAFAAIDRSFRNIDGSENFSAATLALDPKRHCGKHCILGALKPAACDGLPDKILLLGSKVYLHLSNVTGPD
jgi:hypothetical protein